MIHPSGVPYKRKKVGGSTPRTSRLKVVINISEVFGCWMIPS